MTRVRRSQVPARRECFGEPVPASVHPPGPTCNQPAALGADGITRRCTAGVTHRVTFWLWPAYEVWKRTPREGPIDHEALGDQLREELSASRCRPSWMDTCEEHVAWALGRWAGDPVCAAIIVSHHAVQLGLQFAEDL